LIVWCFLAGFSEQLVPKLLTNAESKISPREPPPSKGDQETSGIAMPVVRTGSGAIEEPGKPGPDAAVVGSEAPTETADSGIPETPQDRAETRSGSPGNDSK
jgi:hypothetical protein